jgi:glycosyltransferase involved in cell wall biosynthesis
MQKLKVCVYAICKNEEKFVDAWVESMSEADLIVVTDTGSTDHTVEKLRSHGVIVFEEQISPWRFDVARNISLSHVPEDVDICVSTDLDERFLPGWRAKLEAAWQKQDNMGKVAKTGRYLYNWRLKDDGTPDIQFHYFKVHERVGFRWKCPIHEYLEYIGSAPLKKIFIEGMVLNHYPDPSKSRSSYLPLLEMAVKEDENDSRMRYYLGREYMYAAQWEKCITTLIEYLKLPTSTWKDERCAAMRWIAKSHRQIGHISDAYCWYYKAIAEQPEMRDPYIEFARLCMAQRDWPMAYFLTKEALKITEKSKTFINMGYAWDYTPDDICGISAFYMGLFSEAKIHAQAALEFEPTNERLINNLRLSRKE